MTGPAVSGRPGLQVNIMEEPRRVSTFDRVKRVVEVVCGVALFLAVTVSMAEIVARVFFKVSVDLFFDVSVWLTVWALLLITGFLLPTGEHIAIEFLRSKLGGPLRRILEVLIALITLAYGAVITGGAVLFLQSLYQRGSVFPRSIAVPMWLVELCVPIGMLVFTVIAAWGVIQALRGRYN